MLGVPRLLALSFELTSKADIVSEKPHGYEADSDDDASEPGVFDCELSQLLSTCLNTSQEIQIQFFQNMR